MASTRTLTIGALLIAMALFFCGVAFAANANAIITMTGPPAPTGTVIALTEFSVTVNYGADELTFTAAPNDKLKISQISELRLGDMVMVVPTTYQSLDIAYLVAGGNFTGKVTAKDDNTITVTNDKGVNREFHDIYRGKPDDQAKKTIAAQTVGNMVTVSWILERDEHPYVRDIVAAVLPPANAAVK
jgi:hypothetical protein